MPGTEAESEGDDRARSADQGRRQVMALGFSVVGAVLLAGRMSEAPFSGTLMQVLALAAGFLFLLKGRRWARWLLAAACGFLAVENVLGGVAALSSDGPAWLLFGLAAVHAFSLGVLLVSRPLRAHLAHEARLAANADR